MTDYRAHNHEKDDPIVPMDDNNRGKPIESFRRANLGEDSQIFDLVLLILTDQRTLDSFLSDPKLPESVKLRLVEEIEGEEAAQKRRILNFINSLSPEDLKILEGMVDRNNSK